MAVVISVLLMVCGCRKDECGGSDNDEDTQDTWKSHETADAQETDDSNSSGFVIEDWEIGTF